LIKGMVGMAGMVGSMVIGIIKSMMMGFSSVCFMMVKIGVICSILMLPFNCSISMSFVISLNSFLT
jgi:hypothetical protein